MVYPTSPTARIRLTISSYVLGSTYDLYLLSALSAHPSFCRYLYRLLPSTTASYYLLPCTFICYHPLSSDTILWHLLASTQIYSNLLFCCSIYACIIAPVSALKYASIYVLLRKSIFDLHDSIRPRHHITTSPLFMTLSSPRSVPQIRAKLCDLTLSTGIYWHLLF